MIQNVRIHPGEILTPDVQWSEYQIGSCSKVHDPDMGFICVKGVLCRTGNYVEFGLFFLFKEYH